MKLQPPTTAEEGEARILTEVIKLFDRRDGTGSNWKLMAESLFIAGFKTLPHLTADDRASILRRVHTGAYERLTADDGDSKKGASEGGVAPSVGADIKTPEPRPSK